MTGIILGPGLIGEAASKKAQATAVDEAGGGSIQLGAGLKSTKKFGKAREDEQRAKAAAASALPVVAPAAPVAPIATATDVSSDVVVPDPVVAAPPPVLAKGLSEDDVADLLADDPNAWDIVAEAEGLRAEGWRPRVAQMLLNAGEQAKDKPMDAAVVEGLRKIAVVGVQAEAEKLRAAVDAAPIGTGNPDAPTDAPAEKAAPKAKPSAKSK